MRWIKARFASKNPLAAAPAIVTDKSGWSIDWLVEQSSSRRSEILMAERLIQSCVHEAGHALVTEILDIDTQYLQMNGLEDMYVPPRTGVESIDSGISIADSNQAENIKQFMMGGLFGEVLFVRANENVRFNKFSIDPQRSTGDIQYLMANFASDAEVKELLKNYQRSNNGEFRTIFFENIDFDKFSLFSEMERRSERHVDITKVLYKRWQLTGFGRFRLQAVSGRLSI